DLPEGLVRIVDSYRAFGAQLRRRKMPGDPEEEDEDWFRPVWETEDEPEPPGPPRPRQPVAEPDFLCRVEFLTVIFPQRFVGNADNAGYLIVRADTRHILDDLQPGRRLFPRGQVGVKRLSRQRPSWTMSWRLPARRNQSITLGGGIGGKSNLHVPE
ncbi:MAG TPA: hypothetical protein VKA12_09690, partial [Roseiarcus sp.]|nr:hypothetical protein [Roseiarcus sp.]